MLTVWYPTATCCCFPLTPTDTADWLRGKVYVHNVASAGSSLAKMVAVVAVGMPLTLLTTAQVAFLVRNYVQTEMQSIPVADSLPAFNKTHFISWGMLDCCICAFNMHTVAAAVEQHKTARQCTLFSSAGVTVSLRITIIALPGLTPNNTLHNIHKRVMLTSSAQGNHRRHLQITSAEELPCWPN